MAVSDPITQPEARSQKPEARSQKPEGNETEEKVETLSHNRRTRLGRFQCNSRVGFPWNSTSRSIDFLPDPHNNAVFDSTVNETDQKTRGIPFMISRKYMCIFIHIPKCAGTSIERSLGMHSDGLVRDSQYHRRVITLERSIWPPTRYSFKPIDFAHYVKQRSFAKKHGFPIPTKSEMESFYKFSIVRNPWDRVFSWYRNVIRDPIHRQYFNIAENCTFEEFAESQLDDWILDPQLDWLRDSRGRIIMDYIGLFEDLPAAFAKVRREIGIDELQLHSLLRSKPVDYREHYSKSLRKRVAEKYAEEIEMFDYAFT